MKTWSRVCGIPSRRSGAVLLPHSFYLCCVISLVLKRSCEHTVPIFVDEHFWEAGTGVGKPLPPVDPHTQYDVER